MKLNTLFIKWKMLSKNLKIFIMIFIIGLTFLFIPINKKNDPIKKTTTNSDVSKELDKYLSKLQGVKSAKTIITYENNGIIDVVTEENSTQKSDTTQINKKPIYNGDKNIIIKEEKMPTIKGVCVFYAGDNNEETKNNLYKATKASLGVDVHKIEVVIMKGN